MPTRVSQSSRALQGAARGLVDLGRRFLRRRSVMEFSVLSRLLRLERTLPLFEGPDPLREVGNPPILLTNAP